MVGWCPPLYSDTACPCSPYLYFLTTPKFPSFLPPAADPVAWKKGCDSCWHQEGPRQRFLENTFHKVHRAIRKLIPRSQPDPGSQVSSSTTLTRALAGSSPSIAVGALLHWSSRSSNSFTTKGKATALCGLHLVGESTDPTECMSWESSQLPRSADSS